jgi:hypothetical protein
MIILSFLNVSALSLRMTKMQCKGFIFIKISWGPSAGPQTPVHFLDGYTCGSALIHLSLFLFLNVRISAEEDNKDAAVI